VRWPETASGAIGCFLIFFSTFFIKKKSGKESYKEKSVKGN